jgi:hypothetical protein
MRALRSDKRYTVLLGGTGSGKTFLSPYWHARNIQRDIDAGVSSDASYMAIGPTADMVRDMIVPVFVKAFGGTVYEGEFSIQAAIYRLPTGGKIYFRSADEPLRIEGHHLRGCSVDEPSQMKAAIWPVIQARTALYNAPTLLTGYPTNMGWYYGEVFKRWEAGDKDFDVIQFSSLENPKYPRAEFEKARQRMPAWMFEMRYLGQFRKPFGLVYPTFGSGCVCEPFDVPVTWPTYCAIDPGIFFGALWAAWQNGIYYLFGERYTEEIAPASVHAADIASMAQGIPQGYIYDPARAQDAAELEACGLGPMVAAANPVLAGIATLTGAINAGRFKVMRGRCPNFMDQMERYSFPTDANTGTVNRENPIKKDDHLPDCARYLLQTLEGARDQRQVIVYEDDTVISRY